MSITQDAPSPHDEGRRAHETGLGPDANPHDHGSPDWEAWSEGYEEAKAEGEEGTDEAADGEGEDESGTKTPES